MTLKFNLITVLILSIGYIFIWTRGSFDINTKEFYISILAAIFTDSLSATLFRNTYPKIMKSLGVRLYKSIIFEPREDDEIIVESSSSHMKGLEAVGGKLLLTRKCLIFKSHDFNIQNHEKVFDLFKITSIQTLDENKFRFKYDGLVEKFIVDDPETWEKLLKDSKS